MDNSIEMKKYYMEQEDYVLGGSFFLHFKNKPRTNKRDCTITP